MKTPTTPIKFTTEEAEDLLAQGRELQDKLWPMIEAMKATTPIKFTTEEAVEFVKSLGAVPISDGTASEVLSQLSSNLTEEQISFDDLDEAAARAVRATKARLDPDRTAKPLTEIREVFEGEGRIGPGMGVGYVVKENE